MEAALSVGPTDRPEWTTFRTGQLMRCPAFRGRVRSPSVLNRGLVDDDGNANPFCNRPLGEVGPQLGIRVRVHPGGRGGKPSPGCSTRCCPRCETMLEFAEERRGEDRPALVPPDVRPAA